MKPINTSIIAVAGNGTRIWPATKVMGKEMQIVGGRHAIHHIVKESVDAGCSDIVMVAGSHNYGMLKEYFSGEKKKVESILRNVRPDELDEFMELLKTTNFEFICNKIPKGDGEAVLRGSEVIGNDTPALILFGDDLIETVDETRNAAAQLISEYNKYNSPILSTMPVETEQMHRYGIIEYNGSEITKFLEKPQANETDSRLSVVGKYCITADVFDYLEYLKKIHSSGEIKLADAFKLMLENGEINHHELLGERYDIGCEFGMMKASAAFGLKHPKYGTEFRTFLEKKISR